MAWHMSHCIGELHGRLGRRHGIAGPRAFATQLREARADNIKIVGGANAMHVPSVN